MEEDVVDEGAGFSKGISVDGIKVGSSKEEIDEPNGDGLIDRDADEDAGFSGRTSVDGIKLGPSNEEIDEPEWDGLIDRDSRKSKE
mmetsp:Transcript_7526/g.16305  ORF Transcript_7526/g.16305 Transcript_7526/m.16305 type:complete len:86 (+) Transcript_7526:1421-1678(+)